MSSLASAVPRLTNRNSGFHGRPGYAAKLGLGTARHAAVLLGAGGFSEQLPHELLRLYPWHPGCIAFHLCVPPLEISPRFPSLIQLSCYSLAERQHFIFPRLARIQCSVQFCLS